VKTPSTFDILHENLSSLLENPTYSHLVIAYSGGLDSSVLLDLVSCFVKISTKKIKISLVHVNHGLSDASGDWGRHCKKIADLYSVKCTIVEIDEERDRNVSEEEWARNARYGLLEDFVDTSTCLLTAHHKNDQVETILHHAMSGSGPHGLAGMRNVRRFGRGLLVRPLLNVSAASINKYAIEKKLEWIEDPSNQSDKYLRNTIRQRALPALEEVYPSALEGLYRAGLRQLQIVEGLNEIFDLKIATHTVSKAIYSIEIFQHIPESLHGFLIKRLIQRINFPIPRESHVLSILEILKSVRKRSPVVRWAYVEARLYRDCIYFMNQLATYSCASLSWTGLSIVMPWGKLLIQKKIDGEFLDPNKLLNKDVRVRFRQGGERFQPARSSLHHELKKLFQQWAVPPWERDLIPLLEIDGEIIAVCGYGINKNYLVAEGKVGLGFSLELSIYNLPVNVC
jgi:tRNA(Ile)-lysidine synthase